MSESLPKELSKARELSDLADDAYQAVRRVIESNVLAYVDDLAGGRADPYRIYVPRASRELVEKTHRLFFLSFILGMDHAADGLALADFARLVPEETVSFEEAIAFAKDRVPLTKTEFEQLSDKTKFRAFTVARLSQLDAIEKVRRKVVKHLESEEGENLRTFLEETESDEFMRTTGMAEGNPWYWENVYRTNIQTNYNAGRAMRFEKNRPEYLEFIGIEDSRQTGICEARSGVVRPYDDPWWKENWPPLHFQCRSTVRGIYPEEATARGLTATDIPEGLDPSQKGFGANPLDEESYWKPTGRMRERVAEQLVYGEVKEVEDRLIGGKEEVPVFKSVKEAEQWALSHNVADQVGFKGAKPEVAREFIKAVYDTVWERPKLRANFKFIGTIQERNRRLKAYHRGLVKEELIKKGYPAEKAEEHAKLWVKRYVKIPPVPSRAYAQSAPARGGYGAVQGISINEKFAKNPAELARSLKRDVDQGFHPPGTDSVKALTDHEIGHQLDDMLAVGKNSDIIDLYKGMSADVRASKLSVYGSTSKSEFIAEAWSEYQNNPQPREVARRVGEHITKELDT